MDVGETPGVGAGEPVHEANGLVLCGQQTLRVDDKAHGVPRDWVMIGRAEQEGGRVISLNAHHA